MFEKFLTRPNNQLHVSSSLMSLIPLLLRSIFVLRIHAGQVELNYVAWFPDSGASHHATNDPHNLLQSSTAAGNEHILMANGIGTRISYIGSNLFRSPYFPNTTLSLKNLLLVPSLTKNLLSVSKFTRDNNCFFEFHPSYCCVKSEFPIKDRKKMMKRKKRKK